MSFPKTAVFPEAEFEPVSFCAGLLRWKRNGRAAGEDRLELYIPRLEDGWFYVKMMSDPETMAYNAPWFPPDGCIPEPEAEWLNLQEAWIGKVHQ